MRYVKFFEIIIMIIGIAVFYYHSIYGMIFTLFLMAVHSTFFAPAKAGYIPESCEPNLITKANSIVGMTTFFSIISAMAFAGILFKQHQEQPYISIIYCLTLAVSGWIISFGIPDTQIKSTLNKFPSNPFLGIYHDLIYLKSHKGLFLAALANSYFWLLGLVFTTNILIYGKDLLELGVQDSNLLSLLPGILGIGIAMGSLLAGRLSGKKVEIGLVPLGGSLMALCGILLFWSYTSYTVTAFILFACGVSGGLFVVPLNAYLQNEADPAQKGRILSTVGILNGIFLILGSILYSLLAVSLNVASNTIYLFMGILTLLVVVYICLIIPDYFIRFLAWCLTHTFYKIRIIGSENIPYQGGALLAANHVSFVDALFIGACIQRFIRF
ncbi:MAG: hypothetical protein ACD_73C00502G0001, partial [uncultured bacterium]